MTDKRMDEILEHAARPRTTADPHVQVAPEEVVWLIGEVRKLAREPGVTFGLGATLADVQKTLVLEVLRKHEGNKVLAAKSLGISRRGLYNLLERWGNPEELIKQRGDRAALSKKWREDEERKLFERLKAKYEGGEK